VARRAAISFAAFAVLAILIAANLLLFRQRKSPEPVEAVPATATAPAEPTGTPSLEQVLPAKAASAPETVHGNRRSETTVTESHVQNEPESNSSKLPTDMLTGDVPPYLGYVMAMPTSNRDPRGCKSPSRLLAEMSQESRDELWASRVESELRDLLEPHPLGFPVSVGCRATFCQVTELGDLFAATGPANGLAEQAFWKDFRDRLRASPVAAEFASEHCFAGNYAPKQSTFPSLFIAGCIYTSSGQATPSEPADCAPFTPDEEPAGTGSR
jgi:hypothetical protein